MIRDQAKYYSQFALIHRSGILNSIDPSLWTMDMAQKGPNYVNMCERIPAQIFLVEKSFDNKKPILDLGCGFGRQAIKLAEKRFSLTGVDYCCEFIDIARAIFQKKNLSGEFICQPLHQFKPKEKFSQILLFDVWEHIPAKHRFAFLKHLKENICADQAMVIVTFPDLDSFSFKYRLFNTLKPFLGKFSNYVDAEHPFPIPGEKKFQHRISDYFDIISIQKKAQTLFWHLKLR